LRHDRRNGQHEEPFMTSIAIGLLVFGCVFGAALLAMLLRSVLPEHHLNEESKDIVRLATGLIATMAALLLGLLVASAKSSYDTEKSEVTQMAAKIAFLDRVLAIYGPEASQARDQLRLAVEKLVGRMWPNDKSQHAELDPKESKNEQVYDAIQRLSPQNETQRSLKSQAVATATDLGQARWLLFEQAGRSISSPLLIVMVAWLAIIFFSFGLFAPGNTTVIVALFVAALSVSGAVFLILELDQPFGGVIRISSESMQSALNHLGQ
jgi:hypothetical protein